MQDSIKPLFVRVFYDSDNIKESSVWKIALVDEEAHMLYIETLHDKVSDSIPEEVYKELCKKSYFKGLIGVDTKLMTLKLVDSINGDGSTDINIFVDEDEKIRKKINSYIDKYYDDTETILLVFKDAFEQILFLNFVGTLNKKIITQHLDCVMIDPKNVQYNDICEKSITQSMTELKDNEEMSTLFMLLRIVIEDLILKDLFKYIIGGSKSNE